MLSKLAMLEPNCDPTKQWIPENPWVKPGEGSGCPEPGIPDACVKRLPWSPVRSGLSFVFKCCFK